MASGKSVLISNKILNYLLRGSSFNAPSGLYLALMTVAPTASGGGTEISVPAYARQPVQFGLAVNKIASNTNLVDFGTAQYPWGTVKAFAIYDSLTGGDLIYFVEIPTKYVDTNTVVQVQIGDLRITEA